MGIFPMANVWLAGKELKISGACLKNRKNNLRFAVDSFILYPRSEMAGRNKLEGSQNVTT